MYSTRKKFFLVSSIIFIFISSTFLTISFYKNVSVEPFAIRKYFNYYKNISNQSICEQDKVIKFHQQLKLTKLPLEELNYLLETIELFTRELDKNNIDYIPVGGSLLGIIRNDGLIPYDDDFDMAILEKNRNKTIEMILKHSKLTYLNHFHDLTKVFINKTNCHKPGHYKYCSPFIDIFFFKQNKAHMSYGNINTVVYAIEDIFPRRRAYFNHIPVWIPKKWQAFFTKNDIETCCTNDYNHYKESGHGLKQVCLPCSCVFDVKYNIIY